MVDPDLQMDGGGGGGGGGVAGHPDPEIRGGCRKQFLSFGPHFRLKIRVGGRPSRPLPGSTTVPVRVRVRV